MKRVICIYPHDLTTKFLNRIQTYLKRELGDTFHCYKVKPNPASHVECLRRIQKGSEEFLIFLGHGRTDCLYGGIANGAGAYYDGRFLEENPYANYCNKNFINADNINVFNNKKVFCLSCNSNELGKLAIETGAKVFIGFGDIPTDKEVLKEIGKHLRVFTAAYKSEIVWIIKKSLIHSINRNHNFYQLFDTICLHTNIRINEIVLKHKCLRERRLLADYLYKFKKEMVLLGEGSERILSMLPNN